MNVNMPATKTDSKSGKTAEKTPLTNHTPAKDPNIAAQKAVKKTAKKAETKVNTCDKAEKKGNIIMSCKTKLVTLKNF